MKGTTARAALERDLSRHRAMATPRPHTGWIRAIREALGMSTRELATRVGVSSQRISQIEHAEQDRSLTLATLERIAEGLDCSVEYILVPRRPLDDMVWHQARAKAIADIAAVDHTMALEDQRPDEGSTNEMIETLARGHIDKRGLWS